MKRIVLRILPIFFMIQMALAEDVSVLVEDCNDYLSQARDVCTKSCPNGDWSGNWSCARQEINCVCNSGDFKVIVGDCKEFYYNEPARETCSKFCPNGDWSGKSKCENLQLHCVCN